MNEQLDKRLKGKGLLPSTRKKYGEIIESAGDRHLLSWIQGKVHAGTPLGTVLPLRAAVKHYLVSELGYDADRLDELLPEARGRRANSKPALSPIQLAVYHAAIEQMDREPARTILTLLPMTGLLISEVCALKIENIQGQTLSFHRGNKNRLVPLSKAARMSLDRYIEQVKPTSWLFSTYNYGGPIQPHGLRKYTRKIAMENVELFGLSPQMLRTTYAVMALEKGVELARLQHALGHEHIESTRRYLFLGNS